MSSVAYLILPNFFTLSHNRQDFREKNLLNTKRVFWFFQQLLSKAQRDIIINVRMSSYKVPLLLSDFDETSVFATDIRKIFTYQIS